MKKLIIGTMCAFSIGILMAQDAPKAAAPAVAVTADPVAAAAAAPAKTASDGGTEAIAEAQGAKVTAPNAAATFISARAALEKFAKERKWETRWDQKKGRIIRIESAEFTTKDPGNDKDFFIKRDLAAKKAVLKAKVGIIETFSVQMSGSDMLDVPGSDVEKELGAERAAAAAAVEAQRQALIKLLDTTNKAEADALRGTTTAQRLDDVLVACVKKLDDAYNANQHDEAAKARLDALKKQFEAAQKQYTELKAKADKLNKQLTAKQTSTVSKLAKMPLFGCSAIMQTESWDKTTGRYEVAVLVTWSKLLEEAARAIATGKEATTKPGDKSVNAWLDEQDLSCMVGPRQYVDNEGNRWFLGISSRRYTQKMKSSARERAMDNAEMSASQMAVFSIFADLESYKEAQAVMETRGDGDDESEEEDEAAEKMAKKLSQTFKSKQISGLQQLVSKEVVCPITGEGMYVKVYGLNANDAKEAMATEDRQVALKIESERRQSWLKGRAAAHEALISGATNRPEDVANGAGAAATTIGNIVNPPPPPPPGGSIGGASGSKPPPKPENNGGAWGSGAANDNF